MFYITVTVVRGFQHTNKDPVCVEGDAERGKHTRSCSQSQHTSRGPGSLQEGAE